MDNPRICPESFSHEVRKDGAVIVRTRTSNLYKEGKVVTVAVYTVTANGTIDLETTFFPQGELPELPRLGIAFAWRPLTVRLPGTAEDRRRIYPDRRHPPPWGSGKER